MFMTVGIVIHIHQQDICHKAACKICPTSLRKNDMRYLCMLVTVPAVLLTVKNFTGIAGWLSNL